MKINSIKPDNTNHSLLVEVEISGSLWDDAINKITKKLAKNIVLKGFRKGHVPFAIAKNHLNMSQVATNAIQSIAPEVYKQLIKEDKIQNQNILEDVFDAGVISIQKDKATLIYAFAFVPEVTLLDYKNLDIQYHKPSVTDEEIDNTIQMFDKKIAYFSKKNDKAKESLIYIINFHGTIDNKPFEGSDATEYEIELGTNELLPGFEDQLKGLKEGDKKTFELKLPNDHFDTTIAGKTAKFNVEVLHVNSIYHTKIDDEFAKNLHVQGVNDLKSLREYYRDLLFIQKNATEYSRIKNIFFKHVISDSKVNYMPTKLINIQKQNLLQNYLKEAKTKNLSLEEYVKSNPSLRTIDNLYDVIDKQVKANIIFMFAIDKLYEDLNITASEEDMQKELILLMKETDATDNEVRQKYSNKELLSNMVMQRKLIDKIIEFNNKK